MSVFDGSAQKSIWSLNLIIYENKQNSPRIPWSQYAPSVRGGACIALWVKQWDKTLGGNLSTTKYVDCSPAGSRVQPWVLPDFWQNWHHLLMDAVRQLAACLSAFHFREIRLSTIYRSPLVVVTKQSIDYHMGCKAIRKTLPLRVKYQPVKSQCVQHAQQLNSSFSCSNTFLRLQIGTGLVERPN